jgi:hypothetical protein
VIDDPYARAQTFSFGDFPAMADELLALVIAGTKTATCGALRDFPAGSPDMPVAGRRDVVLDGRSPSAASTKWTRPLPMMKAKDSAPWQAGAKAIRTISSETAVSRQIWNWCVSGLDWWKCSRYLFVATIK